MARYRIGNDMTILWTVNSRDGSALPLKDKEVHLYYTCERGRFEADFEIQETNVVAWNFLGKNQRTLGDYSLSLEILQSDGKRTIKMDKCNAFSLVGRNCEELYDNADADINEGGELTIVSNLDIYRISPIIPKIGENSNWHVDGTDTGMPSAGKSAYEYAKEKGYEGTESEYAESLKLAPENSAKLTELESETNQHFFKEGVGAYEILKFPVLKEGSRITNNGIAIIVADDKSFNGRLDIQRGESITLNSDKSYIQSAAESGEIDFYYAPHPSRSEFRELEEKTRTIPFSIQGDYESYANIPLSMPLKAGMRITNKGISVLLANDKTLAGRINLLEGESVVLDTDKAYLQLLSNSGNVMLECQFLFESSITAREIKDKSISAEKVTFVNHANLINPAEIQIGTYYNVVSGEYQESSFYDATGAIPVLPGKNYVANKNTRFFDFRNSATQQYVSYENIAADNPITAPEWAEYMVATFWKETDIRAYNIIEGTEWEYLGEYENEIISPSFLLRENKNTSLKDISAKGVIGLREELYTPLVHITKSIAMSAVVKGNLTDIRMGVALNGYYGKNIRITNSGIVEYSGSDDTQGKSYTHGLTLTGLTFISMYKGNDAKMTIRVATDKGESFETEITWETNVGQPFFRNNGDSALEVAFTFQPRDIDKDIWMFGDSYFGMYNSLRWPYYILNWGFNKFLLDARGGESAPEALSDLQNLLATDHRPKYIVWCHGMNGGEDNGESVNSTWLSATTQMLNICKRLGITPILATIPSIPTKIHVNLNAWVKNSGHRYIDFASAVETNGSLYWKGWGTSDALLSNDEVHPSEKGAVVLASQVMVDFPEITIS